MGFRLSITIFTESIGQTAYRYFADLIPHIAEPTRHGLGLLRLVGTDMHIYSSQLASEVDSSHSNDELEAVIEPVSDDLASTLTKLRDRLEAENRIYGSNLTQPGPLSVRVVGDISQKTRDLAGRVLEWQSTDIEITYLFCCTPQSSNEKLFSTSTDFTDWATANKIHCSYFYGDVLQTTRQEYRQENFAYAAALALFALLATDLNAHADFTQNNVIDQQNSSSVIQCGTLSACLVNSPYEAICQALVAKIGALLLQDWQPGKARASTPGEEENLQNTQSAPFTWLSSIPGVLARTGNQESLATRILSLLPRPGTVEIDDQECIQYQRLYDAFVEQTTRLFQKSTPSASLFFKRRTTDTLKHLTSSTLQMKVWEDWQAALTGAWDYLHQAGDTRLEQIVTARWHKTDPARTVAYVTRLAQQVQETIRQLERSPITTQPNQPATPARASSPNQPEKPPQSLQNHLPDEVEQLQAEFAEHLDTHPSGSLLLLTILLMASMLSLTGWAFFSEFWGQQFIALLVLLPFCFCSMFLLGWLHLRSTYTQPGEKLRHAIEEKQFIRCLEESNVQRLELARHTEHRLTHLSTAFLAETAQYLEQKVLTTLEHPFQQNTGGRNFLCGNGRLLENRHETQQYFIEAPGRAGIIYQNLSRDKEHGIAQLCAPFLLEGFQKDQDGADFKEKLQYAIRSAIDPNFSKKIPQENRQKLERSGSFPTTYLSRNDFALDNRPGVWQRVLDQTRMPSLWHKQAEISQVPVFLCTTSQRIGQLAPNFSEPPIPIETPYVAERPVEITSNWILLVALYRQPLPLSKKMDTEQSQ